MRILGSDGPIILMKVGLFILMLPITAASLTSIDVRAAGGGSFMLLGYDTDYCFENFTEYADGDKLWLSFECSYKFNLRIRSITLSETYRAENGIYSTSFEVTKGSLPLVIEVQNPNDYTIHITYKYERQSSGDNGFYTFCGVLIIIFIIGGIFVFMMKQFKKPATNKIEPPLDLPPMEVTELETPDNPKSTSDTENSTKYCIECGTKLPGHALFCAKCGAKQ